MYGKGYDNDNGKDDVIIVSNIEHEKNRQQSNRNEGYQENVRWFVFRGPTECNNNDILVEIENVNGNELDHFYYDSNPIGIECVKENGNKSNNHAFEYDDNHSNIIFFFTKCRKIVVDSTQAIGKKNLNIASSDPREKVYDDGANHDNIVILED